MGCLCRKFEAIHIEMFYFLVLVYHDVAGNRLFSFVGKGKRTRTKKSWNLVIPDCSFQFNLFQIQKFYFHAS